MNRVIEALGQQLSALEDHEAALLEKLDTLKEIEGELREVRRQLKKHRKIRDALAGDVESPVGRATPNDDTVAELLGEVVNMSEDPLEFAEILDGVSERVQSAGFSRRGLRQKLTRLLSEGEYDVALPERAK